MSPEDTMIVAKHQNDIGTNNDHTNFYKTMYGKCIESIASHDISSHDLLAMTTFLRYYNFHLSPASIKRIQSTKRPNQLFK